MVRQMDQSSSLPYRVQVTPSPIVIGQDGLPIANSYVVEINFLGEPIDTVLGRVNTLIGPGTAKVIVGDTTHRGVSLA